MGQLIAVQTTVQKQGEVRELLALSGEPGDVVRPEDGVEQHQPFDRPRQRRGPSKSVVGFANRIIETPMVNVEQSAPPMGASIGRGESPGHESPKEIADVLATDDTGERAVLTQHANARVKHDSDEEP